MPEQDSENLEDILRLALGEDDLSTYEEVLSSADFQLVIRAYHAQVVLQSIRDVVLGLIDRDQLPLEVMLKALVAVWLDKTSHLSPELNQHMSVAWIDNPLAFCQVLFQHAVDVMSDHRDELKLDLGPEIQDMYETWTGILPEVECDPGQMPEDWDLLSDQTCTVLLGFDERLRQKGLQIEEVDYHDAWTHVLLQLYIFAYMEVPDFYYVLVNNWGYFAQQMPMFLKLFLMLRGYEELLMPENRNKLLSLLNDPKVQEIMAERQKL